jgi:prepilin-type N-terminal cleavage/methylation domain-containing protein
VRNQRGFTLIELIVVVAVMAVITVAVVTGVGNVRGASVQSETGKIGVAVRYLYNLTVLSGKVHRLVFDLDKRMYWGEEQTTDDPCQQFLLPGEGDEEEAKKAAKRKPKKGKGGKVVEEEPAKLDGGFAETKSRLLAKYTLDAGISIAGVMTSHQNEPLKKGTAYLYFFPNGTTENALIWVKGDGEAEDDDADVMTVEVKALQGAAKLHSEKVPFEKIDRADAEKGEK